MILMFILAIPLIIMDIYALRKYRDIDEGPQTSRYFIILSMFKKTSAGSKFSRVLLILYFSILGIFMLDIIFLPYL